MGRFIRGFSKFTNLSVIMIKRVISPYRRRVQTDRQTDRQTDTDNNTS